MFKAIKMADHFFRQYIFLAITLFCFTKVYAQDYFTAAVFAHARRGAGSSDPPEKIIANNLNMYERAATVAKENKADMIVFPQYGMFYARERKNLTAYMENIPDPKDNVIPCLETSSSTPILKNLSCIARNNSMNVIANMGDVKNCSQVSKCPDDGKLYYNTNVVFDRNGTLVYRYYKQHLWFEPGMNAPTEKQDITFTNDIGHFANLIGVDLVFSRASPDSVLDSVDAVLYLTMGSTIAPLAVGSANWQAWGMANNLTILAANLQLPGGQSVGSGIYVGRGGAIANTYGADGISKLIISKVPKKNKEVSPDTVIYAINETNVEVWNTDNEHIPAQCDIKILGPPKDVYTDYRCTSDDVSNYTLIKLNEPEGHLKECNNGLCCEIDYAADSMNETYYFGVFNGTYNAPNNYSWPVENCFLARCDDVDDKPCAEFLMQSNTTFNKVSMTANFTTPYNNPTFVASEMKLVPVKDWKYETEDNNKATIYYLNESGAKLLVSGFKGRPYDRDPPYTTNN